MSDLVSQTDSFSPFMAILWIFYPMALLVGVELLLRALRGDDDDDDFQGGKGVRVMQMQYSSNPA